MVIRKRNRRCYSLKEELLQKSRESVLSAVQIFNTPSLKFRAETFIVLMNIGWTYLLHAYFRQKNIEFRVYKLSKNGKRRVFTRTHNKNYVYLGLDDCISCKHSPLDKGTINNIKFMIGLRNEIEHQMTTRIEEAFGARFLACCLNYNSYIKNLFGEEYGIDQSLSFAIQFTNIGVKQASALNTYQLPSSVNMYINDFDKKLSDDEFNDPHFSCRLLFVQKIANSRGQADKIIEFVKDDKEISEAINKGYRDKIYIQDREKPKYYVKDIIEKMHELGYVKFNTYHHTQLWKKKDAKNPGKGYCINIHGLWYWYDSWIGVVTEHCEANKVLYQ